MMNEQNKIVTEPPLVRSGEKPAPYLVRWRGFVMAMIILALCFSLPLWNLIKFAAGTDLYSHIFLIPFVSLYLIWIRRKSLPTGSKPPRKLALFFLLVGTLLLGLYWFPAHRGAAWAGVDRLALSSFFFLLFSMAVCCWFIGGNTLRAMAFPLAFLIFMVPIPTYLMDRTVTFLQYGSASVAQALFNMAGTPNLREGLIFRLPGMSVEVAPACSGIHSTMVLFITSLVAGYLLLREPWQRGLLTLAVIPLALLRNGFRILTIGELCVHVGPHMIDSPLHRRGGPIFFALSLVPFFLLLYFLRRSPKKVQSDLK